MIHLPILILCTLDARADTLQSAYEMLPEPTMQVTYKDRKGKPVTRPETTEKR